MDLQVLNEFSVKVNKGSGCLIQPLTDQYSYVLTAKHLLKGFSKERIKVTRQYLSDGKVIEQPINVIGVYHHSDKEKDASIIKVEFIEPLKKLSILPTTQLFTDLNKNYLVGHPKIRQSRNFSIRPNQITLIQTVEYKYIEIEFKKSVSYDEILGQSGSGIINVFEQEFYLMGVQSQMVSEEDSYCLMMPVSFFEEIIACHSAELSKFVYPSEKGFEALPQKISANRNNSVDQINIYPTGKPANVSIDIGLMNELENLKSQLSQEISNKLEGLKESFRREYNFKIYEEVKLLRNSPNWGNYESRLRGSILRTMAIMILTLKSKEAVEEAQNFADEAQKIDGSFNEQALRARIIIYKKGFAAAIGDLENYHDTETFNLYLNCLLYSQQYPKVILTANNIPANIIPNAETYRLLALAYLGSKNIPDAQIEIKKAIDEKPDWQFVRVTNAMINYYSAISENGLTPYLEAVPHPIFPDMVKIDDLSQQNLENAAQEFLTIAQQYEENTNEQKEMESWHFASLANLFNKTNDAIKFGKNLLAKNPGNLEILSWFLFRNFDHDFTESVHLLEQNSQDNNLSMQGIITLVRLYLKLGRNNDALTLIEKGKTTFSSPDENELLQYWKSQTYLNDQQLDKAEAEAKPIIKKELKTLSQYNLLYYKGEKQNDWKPILKFLKSKYDIEGDIDSFLTLFELKAEKAADPRFLVKNVELYCDRMGTAGTVYQVIVKLWKLGKFTKCLEILDKYAAWFPEGQLPNYLKKIKINCLIKIKPKSAVEEAQQLKSVDKSAENIMLLMEAQISGGDLGGFKVTSKELLTHPDANPENLLKAANLVQLTDGKLATKFWTKANEMGIPDDPNLIVFAKDIALKLGLEYESRGLMRRMMQNAHKGQGPMKLMSFRQLLRFLEKRNKYLDELEHKYRIGEAPIHILAKERNITLAEVFNIIADRNKLSGDLHNRPRILIRHGSKPLLPDSNFEQSRQWNVHLDITSLLLAQKLGILDDIEKGFNKIIISPETITALLNQLQNLYPHQKSQLDSCLNISKLSDESRFTTIEETSSEEEVGVIHKKIEENGKKAKKFSNNKKQLQRSKKKNIIQATSDNLEKYLGSERLNLIAKALAENGFPVLLLPLNCYGTNKHSVLKFPESISNFFLNCRAVCETLIAHQRISEEKYKKALSSLGQESNFQSQISPLPKSKLFMLNDVAGLLANAGILEEVCETFEVVIPQNAMETVYERIHYYQECKEVAGNLGELIERINDGLKEGIYDFTLIPDERTKKDESLDRQGGEDFNSTLQLFLTEPQEHDVICIDDRALNKFSNRLEKKRSVPIIGINEILQSLLINEVIDEQKYYNLLLELRRCNFRYIPITAEEIHFHLQRASIRNGLIIESEGLTILRQYHNSTLLDKKYLQILNSSPLSETTFIFNSFEEINISISQAWLAENLNREVAIAQSDWIFDNLFAGYISLSHLRNEKATNKLFEINTVAFDISNLIMKGLFIRDDIGLLEVNENRLEYFTWLTDKVIFKNCISDPEILTAIASEIKSRFKIIQNQEFRNPQERTQVGYDFGRFYLDLPKFLSQKINFNEETKTWLNIRTGNAVTILGIIFDSGEYWEGIAKAIEGKSVPIKSIKTGMDYVISCPPLTEEYSDAEIFPIIEFKDQNNVVIGIIQDATFALLKKESESRLIALRELRFWFDCSQSEFEDQISNIVKIDDPIQRTNELLKIRGQSTEFYYSNLENRFKNRERVIWKDLFPPSAFGLLRSLRLPINSENKQSDEIWSEAAEALLAEQSLENAIAHCSCLPKVIPTEIIEKFTALSREEKFQTLQQLSAVAYSPIQLLHLTNLALRHLNFDDEKEVEFTSNLIDHLFENQKNEKNVKAFQGILKFVKDGFRFWKEADNVYSNLFFTMLWVHSSKLYNILRTVGLSPENIITGLNDRNFTFPENLSRKAKFWNDCLHPNRINRTKFLTHAAANLFSGISQEILEKFKIPQLIKSVTFPKDDEEILAFSLFGDPRLCQDSLESLFGGDRFEILSSIIGSEGIEILNSDNLKQSSNEYLEMLINNPQDLKPWILIYLISDDLPIYPELKELLIKAITLFDPANIYHPDVEIPTFLLLGPADQIPHLNNDEVRLFFRNIILETARQITKAVDQEKILETKTFLIEAALAFSYHPGNPELSNEYFITLMEEIDFIWEDINSNFGFAFSNLIWDMPIEESKAWREFNLKIRTKM